MKAVKGSLVSGDEALLSREATSFMVAGMTAEHCLERLKEGQAVIFPADRSDVLLAVASAHVAEGFPSLSAIILNGGLKLHPRIADLVDGIGLRLPIIETDSGTFETASAAAHARGRVTVASARKIDTALALMDRYVDGADLVAQLAIPIPSVTTPQMFEYQLLDRARDNRKRIVLPEGDDDRILKAADRLLQRQVADLTILGEEAEIRSRAAELGVDISNALVVSPKTSDLAEKFADQYFELRKHKGMTPDRAREIMRNVSYFGTMLVYNDIVDGMVSGAAHTTAHTIRPAFEVIRTTSGVSTVSSIFLMCLADRVLAYGDCAIVPDQPPSSWPISPSRRRGPPRSSASIPGWRCCPTPPGRREAARMWKRCVSQRSWFVRGNPSCSSRGPSIRRGGRAVGGGHQDARFPGGGPCDGADFPRPQYREQHLQGGATQRRCRRHRTRAAGAA